MTESAARRVLQRPDIRHRRKRDPVKNRADQARHRERLIKCRRVYRAEVDGLVLDMLVARKYLEADETGTTAPSA